MISLVFIKIARFSFSKYHVRPFKAVWAEPILCEFSNFCVKAIKLYIG